MEFLFLGCSIGFVGGLLLALFLYSPEATNEEAKISFKTFSNLYVNE